MPDRAAFPRPSVMGVVNVTPDSFSDGGRFLGPSAVAEARGHSRKAPRSSTWAASRPGPARRASRSRRSSRASCRCSSASPRAALDRHVEGRGRPPGARARRHGQRRDGAPRRRRARGRRRGRRRLLCLMHMLGEPRTMQDDPRYDDVVSEVAAFLEERLEVRRRRRGPEERICLDPGIGFGKTVAHNLGSWRASTARRARAAGPGGRLAQALPRPPARRSRRAHRPASRRASPSPCSPTSAARRSSGCTTCGSTSEALDGRAAPSSRSPA